MYRYQPDAFAQTPVKIAGTADITPEQAQDVFSYNTIAIGVSREMAIDYGLLEPTPEERAEREAASAEWARKDALRRQADMDMLAALRAKGDPITDAMLDLHRLASEDYPRCDGDDYQGYDAEPGEWPCTTVLALAKAHGIPTREDVR